MRYSELDSTISAFMADVCADTGAKRVYNGGRIGYVVSGKLRRYFVDEESAEVYDADTNQYYSVIRRGGSHGEGNGMLPSLLYALRNDSSFINQIPTIKKEKIELWHLRLMKRMQTYLKTLRRKLVGK